MENPQVKKKKKKQLQTHKILWDKERIMGWGEDWGFKDKTWRTRKDHAQGTNILRRMKRMNEGCDSAKILMDAELEQGERQMRFTYSLWEDFEF